MKTLRKLFLCLLLCAGQFATAQESEIDRLINQGVELHDSGDYPGAIELYKKALELDPNSDQAHVEIGYSYYAAGDYRNSEIHSKKAIELDGEYAGLAYINYGNALDAQGKTRKAIKVYEEGLKEHESYLLYYNHGISCMNSGKLDKAFESAVSAIDLNPMHGSSHLLLSDVMAAKNSRIQAILPLYFFLLTENHTERAKTRFADLRKYLDHGVSKTDEGTLDVNIPVSGNSDFDAAEMMISLLKSSEDLEENRDKPRLQLFAENNDKIFKMLGELKKEQGGIFWELYVPFFSQLAENGHTETYSYYIALTEGEEAVSWLDRHKEEINSFGEWVNQQ
ncbi:MAG: tetratricopeptide repeat protein [Salinimicrobium sp.]